MRTNRLKVHISKDWCFIAFSLFFIILVSSSRNRVMAASDKLNQGTTTAVVDESVQDSTSDRIIYSPNGDIVYEEGIGIIEPVDTNEIYIVIENMPMFPGGSDALLDYLSKNVNTRDRYPDYLLEGHGSSDGYIITIQCIKADCNGIATPDT